MSNIWTLVTSGVPKTIGVINGINECTNLFQFGRSLCSQWKGSQAPKLEDVSHLETDLQCLRDTLPAKYDLIDRAEWRSHENCVAKLLPKLKDAVYDADDLLDEFRWHEQKIEVEGNSDDHSPFIDFFNTVMQGSFNKVKAIQARLENLSEQLEKMGLHQKVTPRFDESVRPVTSSFPTEPDIFGREMELKKLMGLLGVPTGSSRADSKRKRASSSVNASASNQVSCTLDNKEARIGVLPIVGIGGVGKTTLAQHIRNHQQVKSYFDPIIWICVSDDFDVKRLTKDVIQSSSRKQAETDQLDPLQQALSENVENKRFLLILDDMWEDSLKEDMQRWKRFCAPLTSGLQGSMMLVTTRLPEVADRVRTMDPIPLQGLKDDVFWDFFKQCVFGSVRSNNDPELESIGRSVLPKLKGSPLAAKTLGRLLRMDLRPTHWNNILKSELWKLEQNETDILPALRLSYIYLPFHLKRCFSFCAVYPKDNKFDKHKLAEIWVAEGFVEPQGDIPIQDIGRQYFQDLVNRSFFQKVSGTYVIHDLLHDMAQLVSGDDCFILKDTSDFQKVPQNVRHISILSSRKVDCSNLLSLCKHTKLRTLLCNKSLKKKTLASVMDRWCSDLLCMRVISCAYTEELPDSIGKLKHLRYLEISWVCPFRSLPSAFCCLYNLQIIRASRCKLESLPNDFSKLLNLQVFELSEFKYHSKGELRIDEANKQGPGIIFLKNLNQFCGDLKCCNLDTTSKDHAAEAELKNKKYLNSLSLNWSSDRSPERNAKQVLQALEPPTSLESLRLDDYPGESLPSWFEPRNLPNLRSLEFRSCHGFEGISFFSISQHINLNEMPGVLVDSSNNSIGTFSSVTDIAICGCENLSSLEQFVQHVPAVKRIRIENCRLLVSLPTARFEDLRCLEELEVIDCPNISSRSLSSTFLKRLRLRDCPNLLDNIDCCSLTQLYVSGSNLKSIQLQMWTLPALQELTIDGCGTLEFIRESDVHPTTNVDLFTNLPHPGGTSSITTLSSLTDLEISWCKKLSTLDDLLALEYLPAVEKILVAFCGKLQSLPSERFGSFPFLKHLVIEFCPRLKWQRGFVLPPSLERLCLINCGDISAWFPSCLENLTSLVSLELRFCACIESIPGHLWSSNLASLQELSIRDCPDLVSIGGAEAVANIERKCISGCPKLEQPNQAVQS